MQKLSFMKFEAQWWGLENVGLYIFEMCPSEEEKKSNREKKKKETPRINNKNNKPEPIFTAHRRENVQSF